VISLCWRVEVCGQYIRPPPQRPLILSAGADAMP
jgi:hypothetical protein